MSNKSKRKGNANPPKTQQNPSEKNMQHSATKIHGAVEVYPSQDSKNLHTTERQEDTTQKAKSIRWPSGRSGSQFLLWLFLLCISAQLA